MDNQTHMEIFPVSDASHSELLAGYKLEAAGLAAIAEAPLFSEILRRFSNYPLFLKQHQKKLSTQKIIDKLSNGTGIIEVTPPSSELRDIIYTAHIAACCELFNGACIPTTVLRRNSIAGWIEKEFHAYKTAPTAALNQLSDKFHSMDAVRTIQILRCLGLVSRSPATARQLSLGAGPATKDIRSIHLTPEITRGNAVSPINNSKQLTFKVHNSVPADIIITDNDPQREEQYKLLNKQTDIRILALNWDSTTTLKQLPAILETNRLPARNLAVALRIDHRMINDSDEFLSLLARCIEPTADFIVTIGSGFTLDDFSRRTEKIGELFSTLKKLGMNPTIIRLHGKGTLEQQRTNPSFGLSGITTYEILHCKLKKKRLERLR